MRTPTTTAELLANDGHLLYRRANSAAFSAFARLTLHPDERFEDVQQAAAITYWQAWQTKPADYYAIAAARYDAIGELISKSPHCLSLDHHDPDDRGPWIDSIPAPEAEPADPHWLDDHDLPGLVAATLGRNRPAATIDYHTKILQLLAAGYDTAAIATELGRSEESVKSTRYHIRKRLYRYCAEHGIDTDHIATRTGGWRRAHHYAKMDNTAANEARWTDKRKETIQ